MGYVVSVTRLRLRSWASLPRFLRHAVPSMTQAKGAPGNVRAEVRRLKRSFWTLSVWTSEAEMLRYMRSGAHRDAMPFLRRSCDEAATARWTQESAEVTWEEAGRRLHEEGRLHHVDRPSRRHAAGERPIGG